MFCCCGRITIIKNEGTVVCGNMVEVTPKSKSTSTNEAAGAGATGEVTMTNRRVDTANAKAVKRTNKRSVRKKGVRVK